MEINEDHPDFIEKVLNPAMKQASKNAQNEIILTTMENKILQQIMIKEANIHPMVGGGFTAMLTAQQAINIAESYALTQFKVGAKMGYKEGYKSALDVLQTTFSSIENKIDNYQK